MPPGWFITGGFLTMPLLARHARKLAVRHLGGSDIPIAAFTSPHYLPLKRALRPGVAVYHAIDDYTHYWPKRAQTTRRRESRLIGEVDAVICAGSFLAAYLKSLHPDRERDIYQVPNPVPMEFLASQPTLSAYFEGRRSRPVLGYVGTIDARLDHAAMLELARAMPQAEIRIYGSLADPASPLSHAPNIVMCAPVPRSELPRLILDFDVCLIPQSRTHFNLCASPRKLYEYLGSSRPIVALNTPEAESLGVDIVSTHTSSDFVGAVVELLRRGENALQPARRLGVAKSMTPASLARRYAGIMKRYGAGANTAADAWVA